LNTRRKIHQDIEHERAIAGGRELVLSIRTGDRPAIPGILLLPVSEVPAAGAVLLHGYSSRKEDMAGPVGRPLLAEGIATLAIDLPLHGTRADPVQAQSARNPIDMMRLWKEGLSEARLAVHYLAARRDIDRRRIAVVGYSMGSFMAVTIAADEPLIRAVVLAAAGDLPQGTPFTSIVRMVADPLSAVRKLAGRPLLIVHGRHDRTVLPDQAVRLFEAAHEPKELRWYDAGHRLPAEVSAETAAWLRARLP
jgi:uncharacterized protein